MLKNTRIFGQVKVFASKVIVLGISNLPRIGMIRE